MATYKTPDGRTLQVPEYNEIFVSGNPLMLYKRVGDRLMGLPIEGLGESKFKPSTQYPSYDYVPASTRFNQGVEVLKEAGIDLNTISGMSAGQFADVQAIFTGGNAPIRGTVADFKPQPVIKAPNIEIRPSAVNPFGSDAYADGKLISQAPTLVESLMGGGATAQQAVQLATTAAGTGGKPFAPADLPAFQPQGNVQQTVPPSVPNAPSAAT